MDEKPAVEMTDTEKLIFAYGKLAFASARMGAAATNVISGARKANANQVLVPREDLVELSRELTSVLEILTPKQNEIENQTSEVSEKAPGRAE